MTALITARDFLIQMIDISPDAFNKAVTTRGLDAGKPDSNAYANVHSRFNELVWNIGRRLLDVLSTLVESNSKSVVLPDHVLALKKLSNLLQQPLPICQPSKMIGGHGGTVMPGSYFGDSAVDASAYSSSASHSSTAPIFAAQGDASFIRYALPSTFTIAGGGAGAGVRWLSADAMSSIIKEYRSRTGSKVRLDPRSLTMLTQIIERNIDVALDAVAATSSGKKSHRLTAENLCRAACKRVLYFG